MPVLGAGADQQRGLELRQCSEQALAPGGGAFFPRRQIVAGLVVTGKAERHRGDGDARFIVEGSAIHPHPVTQAVTAGVVERQAGFVHPQSRRLADNAELCCRADMQDRPRPMRQVRIANATGANFRK